MQGSFLIFQPLLKITWSVVLSCNKPIGLLSLRSSFCFSTCFWTVSQHRFARSRLTKALQSLYALAEHTASFAHFLSFTTSSEVVIYDNALELSFLFIGTDSYIWSVKDTVLHYVCRKLHYRWALIFKNLSMSQNTGKSTLGEEYSTGNLNCLPAVGLCCFFLFFFPPSIYFY